jgi:hypothetical protein
MLPGWHNALNINLNNEKLVININNEKIINININNEIRGPHGAH